jgi:hypothetical protein
MFHDKQIQNQHDEVGDMDQDVVQHQVFTLVEENPKSSVDEKREHNRLIPQQPVKLKRVCHCSRLFQHVEVVECYQDSDQHCHDDSSTQIQVRHVDEKRAEIALTDVEFD